MIRKQNGYGKLMRILLSLSFRKFFLLTALMFVIACISAVMQSAGVWFKQLLFDRAQSFVEGGEIAPVYWAGLILGGFIILQLVLNCLDEYMGQKFTYRLEQECGNLMNEKAARIDLICYEDSSLLDHVEKAARGLRGGVGVFRVSVSIFTTFLCYFGFMGVYLFRIKPALFFMLLLSFLPYLVGGMVRYRMSSRMEKLSAPYRRKGDFYSGCIINRDYAKETRLLGAYGYFYRLFKENIAMVKNLDWKTTKKTEIMEILLRFISMAGYIGTIILLFHYLMNGEIGVGVFAAVASSLDGMSDKLDNLFRAKISRMLNDLGMAENYLAFLLLPERNKGRVFPEGRNIEFRNVSFSYPKREKAAIKNVSLMIRENEMLAVVGQNGAGKSTFAKLLLGLYDPAQGSVFIDGIDTRELNPAMSQGKISAVFQKFQKYKMTLRENVMISDSRGEIQEERVKEVLKKADLDCQGDSFPDGLETLLSKEFGGVDVSGGQWQRIAIARGLYRSHNLILLDEPTSAIDPLEETMVYQKFMELARGKTAVLITHRLGSAQMADRIVVLDDGEIAEVGSQSELMKKNGLYRKMFEAQVKWYE